jgi:hypothetical protein
LIGAEENLTGAAGTRPILNPPALLAAQAAADEADPFMPQKALREGSVPCANIGEAFHGPGAAKQFCLKPLTPRSLAQKTVHQKLHQV